MVEILDSWVGFVYCVGLLIGSDPFLFCPPEKPEESDKSKSVQKNRSALFDITNDSPIVGLAMQTPSSGVVGKRNMSRIKSTPGSGEALLRGQVKTLLQKVEEDADLTKLSMDSRPFIHLVTSPMGLLAPTPANTPQVLDFSSDNEVQVVITSPVVAGQFRAPSRVIYIWVLSLSLCFVIGGSFVVNLVFLAGSGKQHV